MNGIERIKILASEVTDKPLLKVVDYLCSRDDMDTKYLNEEKSLKQMIEFIKKEAKKEAIHGIAMIDDSVVYSWAIHYFDENNEKLEIGNTQLNNNKNNMEETENEEESISISKNIKKVISIQNKKVVAEGQLSLF